MGPRATLWLAGALLLLGGALGCASTGEKTRTRGWSITDKPAPTPPAARPPLENSRRFSAPFDQVWSATVGTVADQGAPIQVVEEDSGVISTQLVGLAGGPGTYEQMDAVAYRPAGDGFFSTWSNVRYALSIHVTRDTDSTTVVKVTPHIEA